VPTYIVLGKYTSQGIQTIKQSPDRVDAARGAIEAAGGKMGEFKLAMGQYDFIVEVELPSDDVLAGVLLSIGSGGTITTETLRVFSESDFRTIVGKLP
jgi:uncharacterized protein with GYD domain